MAKDVVFKPNYTGYAAIRNSQKAQDLVMEEAQRICDACNKMHPTPHPESQYVCDVRTGKQRAHALVKTRYSPYGDSSAYDNALNNTLRKAMNR